jgi:hypothetical protein
VGDVADVRFSARACTGFFAAARRAARDFVAGARSASDFVADPRFGADLDLDAAALLTLAIVSRPAA